MAANICILRKLPKGARVALPRIFICTIQGYQKFRTAKKLWWYAKTRSPKNQHFTAVLRPSATLNLVWSLAIAACSRSIAVLRSHQNTDRNRSQRFCATRNHRPQTICINTLWTLAVQFLQGSRSVCTARIHNVLIGRDCL